VNGVNDTTGMTHLGAREYDPELGRFITRDSVVDAKDPQQMNGYAYASNTPVTATDPTGLMVINDGGGGGGGGPSPGSSMTSVYATYYTTKTKTATGVAATDPDDGRERRRGNFTPKPAVQVGTAGIPCRMENGKCVGPLGPMPTIHDANVKNGSNAYALGIAADKHGNCVNGQYQIICYGVASPWSAGHPQTIGDVLLLPWTEDQLTQQLQWEEGDALRVSNVCSPNGSHCLDPDVFSSNLIKHEAAHSEQWTRYDSVGAFATDYFINASGLSIDYCNDPSTCNAFEVGANPYQGGYWQTPTITDDGKIVPHQGDPAIATVEAMARAWAGGAGAR
jgi:RHS repeat-associated protein